MYQIAANWESDTQSIEDKTKLKGFISELVGFPCKISCKTTEETVDIYVYSEKKKAVVDWIEIQPSGAVGVIYDYYPENVSVDKIESICDTYNTAHGLTFQYDSDEEGDEADEADEADEVDETNEID